MYWIMSPVLHTNEEHFFRSPDGGFCAALPKNAHYEGPRYGKSMVPPSQKLFRAENRRSRAAILLSISDGGNKPVHDGNTNTYSNNLHSCSSNLLLTIGNSSGKGLDKDDNSKFKKIYLFPPSKLRENHDERFSFARSGDGGARTVAPHKPGGKKSTT